MTRVSLTGRVSTTTVSVLSGSTPLSAQEISEKGAISFSTLTGGGYLKAMKAEGMIHIAEWRQTSCGFSTPLYLAGNQPDAKKPKVTPATRQSQGLDGIVAALELYGPMAYREISAKCGLCHTTIKNARYMEALIEQDRVHVPMWRRSKNGPFNAVYAAGKGKSVPKPMPLSGAQKSKRHRFKRRVLSTGFGFADLIKLQHVPQAMFA